MARQVHHTPLHAWHAAHGATFTEFAGYDMPVHYGSINDEHHTVRQAVGLFDVSHMSNVEVSGPGAAAALSMACPFAADDLELGRGKYTVVLREDATILDDCFVFRLAQDSFLVIPNAGQNTAVAQALRQAASTGSGASSTHIDDVTPEWAIFALQGPRAREALGDATSSDPPKFHRITDMEIAGVSCRVSGTGYTGEKGVEVYVPARHAEAVWTRLHDAGQPHGLRAIGLGARDTLRLEKGYALAGNEFAGGRHPLEAGLGWLIDWDVPFAAREALGSIKASGKYPRLRGLVQPKGVPRAGYVVKREGQAVGTITSGTRSPTLQTGIALAYLDADVAVGDAVAVDVRGRQQPAQVVKPPFA